MKSIIKMADITGGEKWKNPERVLEYYCDRLSRIKEHAKEMKGRYFFIESDDLVADTSSLLTRVSMWLNLEHPLSERYSSFEHTGEPIHGDPSQNIKCGVIKRTENHSDVKIPDALIKKGEYHYNKCRDCLLEYES